MKTIRIGVLGCGKISTCQHIGRFMKVDEKSKSEIVAVYDPKPGRAKKCLEENKTTAKICKSVEELLAEPIDAVVIATPNDTHCPLTLQAIAAGKHVFVEKPMAGSIADAEKMIKAAEEKGVVLLVDQSFRYMKLYNEIKRQLTKGVIGDIVHVRCMRVATQPPSFNWSPGATWYVQKKHDGGVIFDHAVHMADVLQWMVGPIKRVYTTSRNQGFQAIVHCMTTMDFVNGATGTLEHGWNFPVGRIELALYGTKGYILFPTMQKADFYKKGEDKPFLELTPDNTPDFLTAQETFLKAINSKKKAGYWSIGREALAPCEAMLKSAATGKYQTVKYHKESK